ncbi:MAG: division/cell wall cluster transcriptional repressor MraZ [Flavobacteriaceae bacterium]|nr:division/cell wall cluster transcriptional repressor MraZ [Flavobacteriaceae bacterium]|tara:strand:- start:29229 stop:29693 length:465 start_codon:yes stop_codon:yes gene_type:complete
MHHFIGSYECKLDSKGRIMMPIAIKKQLNPIISKGFVIKRAVFNNCLELYPIEEWNILMEKVNSLNRFNKKNNDFIRRFTAGVRTINIDSSGRLLIPKNLIKHVNIKKEIVISSTVNILEIWDKNNYEKAIDEATIDFGSLAEEVMGNKDENLS